MDMHRAPEARIDRYTGPYERWVFSPELGLPYAFPAVRDGPATHFTALAEGRNLALAQNSETLRVPPLWSRDPDVTPFAMCPPRTEARAEARTEAWATGESPDLRLCAMLHKLDGGRFRLNMPIDPATWPDSYDAHATPATWTPPDVKPKVIVGVIDDGIPFMHRAFLDSAGKTRINLVWVQAARAGTQADEPAAVPFGREITHSQINALRQKHGPHEANAYREAGVIDRTLPELGSALTHHATHGAHIAGIAAGNDRFVGAAPLPDEAQIIAVQLPNTIAWDTSGFGKEMMMLSAIEYIFHRARLIAQAFGCDEIPLIVNFSYGWSANRHDGGSSFERAVEALLTERKTVQPLTELVMPTGNNFANRMHAHFTTADFADKPLRFGWQQMPDDRTSSYLEIWLPADIDPSDWNVTVAPPEGSFPGIGKTLPLTPDESLTGGDPRRFTELELDGQAIGQLSADKHLGNRWRVMIALAPTAAYPGRSGRTPVGLWTIAIDTGRTPLNADQSVNVWVQRDDDPVQLHTGGQQSHLVDLARPAAPRALDVPPLTPVRGYGCLNGIGTAPSVMRVSGYVQSTQNPSFYSGAGQISALPDGTFALGPDMPSVCAVADQGQFRPGLASIGTLSGSGSRVVGTSAATAAVTRIMAGNIARGHPPKNWI